MMQGVIVAGFVRILMNDFAPAATGSRRVQLAGLKRLKEISF
jgi:hypothetical protein